jgi:hypothetical protein
MLTSAREHLYRHHQVEICRRCHVIFNEASDLEAHYQSEGGCSAQGPRDYALGFGIEQMKKLKSRRGKDTFSHMKDSDQKDYCCWRRVYQILFPDVDESNIPTPGKLTAVPIAHAMYSRPVQQSTRPRPALLHYCSIQISGL